MSSNLHYIEYPYKDKKGQINNGQTSTVTEILYEAYSGTNHYFILLVCNSPNLPLYKTQSNSLYQVSQAEIEQLVRNMEIKTKY